jgi:toxin ParE1/3/4
VQQLKVRFSPEGRIDYFFILDTLLEQRRGREDAFISDLEQATRRLEVFPEMGLAVPYLGSGFRRIIIWDYVVFYYTTETEVIIERIIHGARDIELALRDS